MKLEHRLQELREDEYRRAPSFERVMRGRKSFHRPPWLWLSAAATACVVAASMLWQQPATPPEITVEMLFEDDIWTTPGDALLAENSTPEFLAADTEIESLTNDINQLVKP
jgi:hypothetical protein